MDISLRRRYLSTFRHFFLTTPPHAISHTERALMHYDSQILGVTNVLSPTKDFTLVAAICRHLSRHTPMALPLTLLV